MTRALFVLNGGSSSLKFAVYQYEPNRKALLQGSVSALGHAPRLEATAEGKTVCDYSVASSPMSLAEAGQIVFALVGERGLLHNIEAIGHRIVHGGEWFTEPVVLDAAKITRLRGLVPLAPLHQPHNLDLVDLAATRLPRAVQVGCFDTAFHAARPRLDRIYGLPHHLIGSGILAYGFHGLSYAHAARVLKERDAERAGGRAIVAHLGNGASLCAMDAGRSVATTMGFSALDGLIMSTRCGAIDPGIILHLLADRGMSTDEVSALLYQQAGLRGLSGISGDMATLLASADPRAAEAIDLFVYRAGRAIGSMAAALGGLDTLVFTAGIGENAPIIRKRIGEAAHWLGAAIDPERNARNEIDISAPNSRVRALVIPADEERAVADEVIMHLKDGASAKHEG